MLASVKKRVPVDHASITVTERRGLVGKSIDALREGVRLGLPVVERRMRLQVSRVRRRNKAGGASGKQHGAMLVCEYAWSWNKVERSARLEPRVGVGSRRATSVSGLGS
jgi:hypothetical protein